MRSEDEIYGLILGFAASNESIRAVLLNGSRANPDIKKDRFQDFDIVYMVTDMQHFIKDPDWVDIFGKCIIMQLPDQMVLENNDPDLKTSFTYLMLFEDVNRIDLTLFPIANLKLDFKYDSLTKVLLDKDDLFKDLPDADISDYLIKRPSQKAFSDHCNEFWWVSTYVVKGLARNEIIYTKAMIDGPVRKVFMKMLEWYIGTLTDFSIYFGKDGRFINEYISDDLYKKILSTYTDASSEHIANALLQMTGLFTFFSERVSEDLQLDLNRQEIEKVSKYLNEVISQIKL